MFYGARSYHVVLYKYRIFVKILLSHFVKVSVNTDVLYFYSKKMSSHLRPLTVGYRVRKAEYPVCLLPALSFYKEVSQQEDG